jgi:hypothetical protein
MVFSGLLRRVALLTRTTRRNNPEETILHSHRREKVKSYTDEKYIFVISFMANRNNFF